VTRDEATALVAARHVQLSHPTTEEWVLHRRQEVERYEAAAEPDDSWRVVLLWSQDQYRYGLGIADLANLADVAGWEGASVEEAALTLRLTWIEEPQGSAGRADGDGRPWLDG
jgi:hypothetical protein